MIDVTSSIKQPTRFNPYSQMVGIAIHHSVTGASAQWTQEQDLAHLRGIDNYHQSIGYGLFGYHMATFPSGRVYLCGALNGQRAHVARRNHELIGIVNIGDFSSKLPSEVQLRACAEAIKFTQATLVNNGGNPDVPIKGHTEWAVPDWPTACPGMLKGFDWTPYLTQGAEDMYNQQDVWAGYFNDKTFPAGDHSFNAYADFGWSPNTKYGMAQFLVRGGAAEILHGNGQVAHNLGWGETSAYTAVVIIKPDADGWWSLSTQGLDLQGVRALAHWT